MDLLTAFITGLAMLIGYWIGKYSKRKRSETEVHWDGDLLIISETGEIVANIKELSRTTWVASFYDDFYEYLRTGPKFIDKESVKKFAEQNYRMP